MLNAKIICSLALILLATAWPGAVQSQGPQPKERWQVLEARIHEPPALLREEAARSILPHIAYQGREGGVGQLGYAKPMSNTANLFKLSFASYRDMNWEVYIARGDGSWPTRLTYLTPVDSRPELNRGATQIVFDSTRDNNYEIYGMNADGSGLSRLTWTDYNEYQPTWSPNSSQIAFYAYPGGSGSSNAEIYVMNADGSGQTRLTWDSAWDAMPTWSPDGGKIAFASYRGNHYAIWTMNADGSNPQQLSPALGYAAYPDWSPDGSKIAFTTDYNNDSWLELAIINTDGSGLTYPLGSSPYPYDMVGPSWAPNGEDLALFQVEWIYYQGSWYWVESYVYGLNLQTNLTYLLLDSGLDWWPDWQTADICPPSSQVSALPSWSGTSFVVYWSGSDEGTAGLESYDVQYKDGVGGTWTDWLLDIPQERATFSGEASHTYYFRCRAWDYAHNLEPYPDGNGDAFTTVDGTPPQSVASSPAYTTSNTFTVTWSGSDQETGLASYDVQYKDGSGVPWTHWFTAITQTQASFDGENGHTYYFQCRARDNMGNLELYPGGHGDSTTMVDRIAPRNTDL